MSVYYRKIKNEADIFNLCFQQNLPLLIKGPTGCGKTQFVSAMAESLNRPLIKVSCNEDTSSADLIGRFLIKNMETVWQDGPVTLAVRRGAILYLDEVAEAREDVIVALHALTDHRRELYIDRLNETLQAPKEFMCIASYNPGYQRGLKDLKPSTRQRFVTVSLDYPSVEIETEIIQTLTGLEESSAQSLCKFAKKIRALPQLSLKETVSTRLLVHTGHLIFSGLNPRQASEVGIINALTDDTKTQQALIDLVALHF